jgi:hypothetical protein
MTFEIIIISKFNNNNFKFNGNFKSHETFGMIQGRLKSHPYSIPPKCGLFDIILCHFVF